SIVAKALAAVVVRARASGRNEYEVTRRIGSDDAPCVRRASPVGQNPPPTAPRGVARISRDRIPTPPNRPGSRIERTDLAAGRIRPHVVGDGRSRDNQPAYDGGRRCQLVFLRI